MTGFVYETRGLILRPKWILGIVIKVCGPRTYVARTGHKARYVHNDHLVRAHDDAPDDVPNDVSEPKVIVRESSDQTVTDFSVNALDNICNPQVNLS